jgi:hypothetical protein
MSHVTQERRTRERVTLQCPVRIFPAGNMEGCHALTVNVSSRGVYCLSEVSFAPGARLQCQIEMTPTVFRTAITPVWLDCVLEVVRIERRHEGFGVGCRIESYVLRRSRPQQRHAEGLVPAGS